eukprot:COSAG05_NODE_5225_length_1231_cov_1.274735_1_plen_332_part_10
MELTADTQAVLETTSRAELVRLRMSELRKRAEEAGASEEQMDQAADCGDEKSALIEVVLGLVGFCGATQYAEAERGIRGELAGLKMSALRKRAKLAGASERQMDDAADGDDETAALTEIVVQEKLGRLAAEARASETALRKELADLKLSKLRKRAKQSGVSEEQMDVAADSENEGASLIELIVLLCPHNAAEEGVPPEFKPGLEPEPELEPMPSVQLSLEPSVPLSRHVTTTSVVHLSCQTHPVRVDEWVPEHGAEESPWGGVLQFMPAEATPNDWVAVLNKFRGGRPLYVLTTRFVEPWFSGAKAVKIAAEAGKFGNLGPGPCFNPNEDNV